MGRDVGTIETSGISGRRDPGEIALVARPLFRSSPMTESLKQAMKEERERERERREDPKVEEESLY